jgi:hypothetical protein
MVLPMQMETTSERDPTPWKAALNCGHELNVVLVYEAFQTGLQGKEVFDLIAKEAGDNAARLTVWRFDFFQSAEMTRAVTRQAEEADVIIVAPRNPDSLPPQVHAWLERWPLRRKAGSGALVALFERCAATAAKSSNVAFLLWRAAERAHMDYFCCKTPVAALTAAPGATHAAGAAEAGGLAESAGALAA